MDGDGGRVITIATFITLGLVPLLYTVFVRDLRLVKWERETHEPIEPTPIRPTGNGESRASA